ncbi:hypothetical protein [Actinokineospora iranica]|uniref:Phosphodiesterase n=1 Tax=Actinokineospora iranica TaxID=1271860 RepID=A0A1G6K9S3_9PSEU|nr:hypothetical protein [Actinokineospora iranica]SDC27066.1 hypothetical protein SAMN05216174_101765 [Actinokineospora iranica]
MPAQLATAGNALVARAFANLARLRGGRPVHSRGRCFYATLAASPSCPDWLPLPHRATTVVVRLSRGAGLPEPLPDVLGLAIRIPDGGSGGPWDILLASSGQGPLRVLPLPAAGWGRARFSTIMALGAERERAVLLALPSADLPDTLADLPHAVPLRFTLTLADERPIGHLTLLAEATGERVDFDPMANRPERVPLWPRWLADLRREAYVGSRRGGKTRNIRDLRDKQMTRKWPLRADGTGRCDSVGDGHTIRGHPSRYYSARRARLSVVAGRVHPAARVPR